MLTAINSMMLDMLAAIARKDYTDRRRRQQEGVKKAKQKGFYRGRMPDQNKHDLIRSLRHREIYQRDGQTRWRIGTDGYAGEQKLILAIDLFTRTPCLTSKSSIASSSRRLLGIRVLRR